MKVSDIKRFICRNGKAPFKIRQVIYLPVFRRTSKSHNKSDKSYKCEWVPGIARISSLSIIFSRSKYHFTFKFTTTSNSRLFISYLSDKSYRVDVLHRGWFFFSLPKDSDLFSFSWAKSLASSLNLRKLL